MLSCFVSYKATVAISLVFFGESLIQIIKQLWSPPSTFATYTFSRIIGDNIALVYMS